MSRRTAAVFAALLLTAFPANAQRLSSTVTPDHYTLWLAPDLAKQTFRGRETIQVSLAAPSASITLHAAEITFQAVSVTAGGRTQAARVALDPGAETATLFVPQPVPAGDASIAITYTGILNDKLRGFYISNANNRSYAVSQMEATDARRVFPSFDEPAFKATFDISLMIDAGDTAISNGRLLSDTPGPEPRKHTVVFSTTPRMSTYLVALAVGDFVCRGGRADQTPIRVCSTADKRHLTAFALEAAEQQIAFFNRYFGVPFPFEKLDIVGVPDFAAGAMENTGAIFSRERLLLADPDRTPLAARKAVASVTAHEIAHQWFGDLVTMKWWDDLWLNEGFATWLASKPLAEWKPEWRVEVDDAEETQRALSLDVLRSTRPIRTGAGTPDEINELFDAIVYEKTAAVLRMIEAYVGPEQMRAGIAAYLRKYAFSNTAGEDFWNEMTSVTGKPVDRIMRGFVEQPGAPLLTIRTACSAGTTDITMAQARLLAPANAPASSSPQTWVLPVCFKAGDAAPRCVIIDRSSQRVEAPGCENVFANAGSRGYYLTEYTPAAVRALARGISALAADERVGLLGDEWWMVRTGRHDVDAYLDLSAALAADDTPAITAALADRLARIADTIVDPDQSAPFRQWIRARFGPQLESIGLPGEAGDDERQQGRRAMLLRLVGVTGGDAGIQRLARELASRYLDGTTSLAPALVSPVLEVAALSGDAALYDRYVAQLQKLTGNPQEYFRFFNALPWFTDPALVRRTLAFAMSPPVRSQDAATLIAGLMARPGARDAAWAFVTSQWDALTRKLDSYEGLPAVVGATEHFCSLAAARGVRQFFADHPVPSARRRLLRSLEQVEACATMDARQSPPFATWLATANQGRGPG